jgi:hypothetical protein
MFFEYSSDSDNPRSCVTTFDNDATTIRATIATVNSTENSDHDAEFVMVSPLEKKQTSPEAKERWKFICTLDDVGSFESWRSDNPMNWQMITRSKKSYCINWINYSCCTHIACKAQV